MVTGLFVNGLWVSLLVTALFGCGHREVTPEELEVFIRNEEHGLVKSEEVNGTTVVVAFRPTDAWVSQEVAKAGVTKPIIDSLRKRYDSYYYFLVSLSRNGREALHSVNGFGEYSDLLSTLSFKMNEYVNLTTAKGDTIAVGDFMLNRTYGMSSSTDLLFVFNREEAKGKEWVQFNLNEFGLGMGNQRFRFETKNLESTPSIKF